MQVKILEKHFGGVEFAPEMRVLHLGGQSSANVERLEFTLPESWQGKSITLHIQRQDGSLPAPILLDENASCTVGKEFTASRCGSWMLLALGEDGFRALTRPARYDCYETLATDGDAEISPTQYETFVARVLAYSNSAATSAQEARNSAGAAAQDAQRAEGARTEAVTAAGQAVTARTAAESGAKRAEAAAERAELTAPEDGAVKSVNGKGGVVTLTAGDVDAVPEDSAGYVKSIQLTGRTLTLTMGDGSTRTLQTKDTTVLTDMTGVLGVEHGGTGKNTALTAADVGAYGKNETYAKTEVYRREETYSKTEVYNQKEADAKFGTPYSLPPATAAQLGGVKVGDYLDIAPDGTLSGKTLNDKIAAAVAVKSEPRLVWNHYEETGKKWKTYDIKMPDGLDYVHVKTRYNGPGSPYGEEVDIAKGSTVNHDFGNGTGIFASNTTFRTDGTLHFATEFSTGGYTVEIWLTGYHYPTLAELLAETQAAQADTDALAVDQEYRVAMLELGLTDDTTTDTTT